MCRQEKLVSGCMEIPGPLSPFPTPPPFQALRPMMCTDPGQKPTPTPLVARPITKPKMFRVLNKDLNKQEAHELVGS